MQEEAHDRTCYSLAARVLQLWDTAGNDLPQACEEFERLVAQHGRSRMARAILDAELSQVIQIYK